MFKQQTLTSFDGIFVGLEEGERDGPFEGSLLGLLEGDRVGYGIHEMR